MKSLIVEDDFTSRLILQEILKVYGPAHIAVNGREAVDAVEAALNASAPYDLVCLDIMMPEMDGQEALTKIRSLEEARGILSTNGSKIFMTTALEEPRDVVTAFKGLCDAYIVKPIVKGRLLAELRRFNLIGQ